MVRLRNMWCAVRSSVRCSLPGGQVTHPSSRVSISSAFSMRTFRVNGAASVSYSFPLESTVACPFESFDLFHIVVSCQDRPDTKTGLPVYASGLLLR